MITAKRAAILAVQMHEMIARDYDDGGKNIGEFLDETKQIPAVIIMLLSKVNQFEGRCQPVQNGDSHGSASDRPTLSG